jgi:hypothetical protein
MQWVPFVVFVLLLAGAVTAWLLKVRLPRDENAAGVVALAGMSWRDFINVVLGALTRRGYSRVFDEDAAHDDSEYILERGGKRSLLSCKHGSAFVLGPSTLAEMASAMRLRGLEGGFLLTQGRISEETRPVAALHRIELLDGPTLWPELRDLMPLAQRTEIEAQARQRARKQVLLTWLLALFAVIVLLLVLRTDPDNDTIAAGEPAALAAASPAAPDTSVAPVPQEVPVAAAPPTFDAAALERQRADVANAISTLPMVDRAVWATQSTLQVYLLSVEGDAKKELCPLMERYPALAASRVQVTPPPESDVPQRFMQCRAY